MGVTRPDPPPQDTPPPRGSSPSLDKSTTSWQLSSRLQQLLFSSELKVTTHDVFSEEGREKVVVLCYLSCGSQPQSMD